MKCGCAVISVVDRPNKFGEERGQEAVGLLTAKAQNEKESRLPCEGDLAKKKYCTW